MKATLLPILLCLVSCAAYSYEGTPQPGILAGKTFTGTVKSSETKSSAIAETIECGTGQLNSKWAAGLGFGPLKWRSGEISGDSKSETLTISVSATNEAKDTLEMNVIVQDEKTLSAKAKLTTADGKTIEFTIHADIQDLKGSK